MFNLRQSFLVQSLLFVCLTFVICRTEALGKIQKNRKEDIVFSSFVLDPASGKKPDSIVVLLHGYGDTGENFLLLGALLGKFLPDTLFIAPDGPIDCKAISFGKQWLSAPKDNRSRLLKEITELTPSLNRYLDNLLKTYSIAPEKLALVGFSQGARIALHTGLRRPTCAGIVALSGSYLDDPTAVNLSRPPILIVHGTEDKKAPIAFAHESYKRLEALKMPVTLILLPDVEHDIDPQEVVIVGEFLKDRLARQ